jgi:diguanylate cyclase (GGDEF)-like protein/PAS domain S-box-containing protein
MPHGLVREHLLAALLESPEEGILGVSLDGVIETWSRGAELIYGYTAPEIIGQPLSRLVPLHELPELETLFSEAAAYKAICSSTTERLHKDGSRIFLKIKRVLVRDERGEVRGLLESACTLNSYGGNAASEWPLQAIVEQMPGFFWTTDCNLRIRSNWGKGMAAAKIHPGALAGRSVCEFLGCADRHRTPIAEHYDALRGISSNFEYHWKNHFLEIRLEPLRASSGEINGCLALATDVTGRKNSEEQAHYQARHDALTGLANYREFMDRLEQEVSRAERSHHQFTLLLLDLDGLKRINDLQGHLAGNRALKRLAAVMNEHCRSTDLAVRYGGDEFAVVLIDSDKGMAEQVAQRIGNGLRTDRVESALSVSIGIGVYPDDGRTAAELIESADRQLYKCKRAENKSAVSAAIQNLEPKRVAH